MVEDVCLRKVLVSADPKSHFWLCCFLWTMLAVDIERMLEVGKLEVYRRPPRVQPERVNSLQQPSYRGISRDKRCRHTSESNWERRKDFFSSHVHDTVYFMHPPIKILILGMFISIKTSLHYSHNSQLPDISLLPTRKTRFSLHPRLLDLWTWASHSSEKRCA